MSSLLSRIRNIWRLSEYEPRKVGVEPPQPNAQVAQLIKKQEGRFIPYQKQTEAEKIVNEQP